MFSSCVPTILGFGLAEAATAASAVVAAVLLLLLIQVAAAVVAAVLFCCCCNALEESEEGEAAESQNKRTVVSLRMASTVEASAMYRRSIGHAFTFHFATRRDVGRT